LHDAHSHDAHPRGARDAATGRRPLRFDVEQQAGKINVDGSRAVGVRKPGGLQLSTNMLREAVGYDKADLAIACQGLEYRRAGQTVRPKSARHQEERPGATVDDETWLTSSHANRKAR
jgi:hypothetical protein